MAEAAHKQDIGKPQYHLIPQDVLLEVVRVMSYGALKYDGGESTPNYMRGKGIEFSRLWDAAQRHLAAWHFGQELDTESGLPHLAHALASLFMLAALDRRPWGERLDDRPRFPRPTSVYGEPLKLVQVGTKQWSTPTTQSARLAEGEGHD
jgi:hypothetical protein